MEAGVRKRDTGRARRGHAKPEKQVGLGLPNRKRRRSAEDEDVTEHTHKSPRIQKTLNKRCHNPDSKLQSQPSRKSPRLQEIRDLNQQRIARAGKRTRSSPRIKKAHHYGVQEQPQAKRGFLRSARKSEQRRISEGKDEEQSKSSLANPERKESVKRRRSTENGDISNSDAKRLQRHDVREQARLRSGCGKDKFIENWLSTSRWSRRSSVDNKTLFGEVSDDMPRKAADVLPSPSDSFSFNSNISSSRKTEKSTASVHDTDYRNSLRYRNIYINHDDPSVELVRRATRIISRPRASPEMDDRTVQELRNTARRLENEAEDVIVQQLAPGIIPAMKKVPDSRLASNADQPWFNSVPVSLNPNVLTNPLPLPRPKPDLAFGYSEAAFTEKQLMTIDLLIDDQFGRSYAVPDQKLRFPFLDIEFKSQAKNGTHYIATNQVAGAGAIALNGNFELYKRSFGAESFDFSEPHFFSVTMDHQLACVNVHWLSAPTDGGRNSFHVEGISQHLLRDPTGLRAVTRAIKNILDYGSDARLRKLCEALDAYREKVILERNAVITERDQRYEVQTELRPEERLRSRKIQLPSHEQEESQRRPNIRAKEGLIVHAGEDWADRPEGTLQVERRRHDGPLPPSTHQHAADKPRTDLQQALRRHSQRLQEQRQNPSLHQSRLTTKVSSKQMVHKGKPGQRIRYNGRTVFVASDRWTAFSRDGRDGLYCAELDVYTYLT